jgi:hypothetical protein
MTALPSLLPDERIVRHIYRIRDQKVMLDADLATLYGVETRRLNEQVKRNLARFPEDFMFQLTEAEVEILKSHFAISSWGGRRTRPYAFTEQGVAMLSSVLHSERAIQVNIQIMRTFTHLRQMLAQYEDLRLKLEEMEARYDGQLQQIFDVIDRLLREEARPKNPLGFQAG